MANRIRLPECRSIVDLGCGPGNSTSILQSKWPNAQLIGVDNSATMLQEAGKTTAKATWINTDIASWTPEGPVDLLFSNAALHWLPDHEKLITRLAGSVTKKGVLAFQIPSSQYPTARKRLYALARSPKWQDKLNGVKEPLTMHPPEFYYDVLSPLCTEVDIWESEYFHVLPNSNAIVDWIASTGMRPFLSALPNDALRLEFTEDLKCDLARAYTPRPCGSVLYPFRRTFVIAYRSTK